MDGIVYFLRAADGPVKVGWCASRDGVARRLRAAQLGHPARLQVVATIPGDRTLEHQLHHRWRNHRLEGEWFHPNPDMLGYLAGLQPAPPTADLRAAPAEPPPAPQPFRVPAAMRHRRYWIDVVVVGALIGGLAGTLAHPLAGPVAIVAMLALGVHEARRPPRNPYPQTLNPRSTMRALGWSVKVLAYIYLSPLIAVRAIWRGLYRPRVRVRL